MVPRLLVRDAGKAFGPDASPVDLALNEGQSRYLGRVLRLPVGAPIEIFDGEGRRFRARLIHLEAKRGVLRIETECPTRPLDRLSVTLGQCLSSADKMDWTIEKAVELGARRLVPLFSERSPIRFDRERGLRKSEHWQAIIEAACMQCGEDRLPELCLPRSLSEWLAEPHQGVRLTLSPDAEDSLPTVIIATLKTPPPAAPLSITLLIGPESGLSEAEIRQSARAGFVPVRMGSRILRTETAGPAALSALQALTGGFD